ncbi:MAG: hypothetical protein FJY54_12475 [Betaproteobacteria bacterium]|nr:hypothetical protein [Betaproteobacteria bacterium]
MTFKRFLLALLAFCVIVVAGLAIWLTGANFHPVIAGKLYRSAQPKAAQLEAVVKQHGIKTVINLRGSNREKEWYRAVRNDAPRLGIEVHDIEFRSRGLPDIAALLKLVDALQRAPRPLLVHCRDGADRPGLASAVALLLDGNHDLDAATGQTSLYYRVIREDSIGREFLRAYRAALEATGRKHTPEHLISWIKNGYVDSMGNLRFIIDHVDNRPWPGKAARYELKGNVFTAAGWAFDQRNEALLKDVTVLLDGKPLPQTRYRLMRKDVAEVFEIPAVAASGWAVEADISGWPRQCYDVSLRLIRPDAGQWQSPTLGSVCLR